VVSATDPYGRILDFLDRSSTISSKAEWTPLQNHYFSENMVEPGIELGPLTTRP
jgi:hypothetical protein